MPTKAARREAGGDFGAERLLDPFDEGLDDRQRRSASSAMRTSRSDSPTFLR
jgi:hypothetical protein